MPVSIDAAALSPGSHHLLSAGTGDALDRFLPPVAAWFRATFEAPTPAQQLGWPAIAQGRNTLLLAPTGSGKTLAAFLACLDHLWRNERTAPGARIVYVSPLKALNEDIARNLRAPLDGVLATAESLGKPLLPLRVAVRTGDTPTAERQRFVRKPPDILITTPESLHLMLTSRARETLRRVSHVIVDEIHALAPNKRGVFMALLLERLEAVNPASFVRIGLSATQRPLEEVARYLGGRKRIADAGGTVRFEPRPVTIVDAGRRKELDLEVSFPGHPIGSQLEGSVWPAIEQRLFNMVQSHRSTIVFTNNRRVAERLTAHLNELASGAELARSHHGSLSLDRRRATEEALKRGELPAVVATASLEMGIDMGAVDLVCQIESPGAISRGLQRVGRAGHLVGRASKGRLIAKTTADLLESAALARAMLEGQVEVVRVPVNCLDVLAQQVVACVAMDAWDAPALFDLVRGAYPYRDLTAPAFEAILKLVSGRFHMAVFRDLRARVSWDRVHNRLNALPGTAQLALVGGGTIPDTGNFPLYLGDGGPRIGELDEEFVLERRVGDTFVLGTSSWRIEAIEPQRVLVGPAAGRSALMPFWRGEAAGRTVELGTVVGALTRELAARRDDPEVLAWLQAEYRLDPASARLLRDYVARQVRHVGAAPDDRTVLVETFRDPAGELGLAVLTPYGARFHNALRLLLQARLRDRLGISVASLHGSEGALFRLPEADEPPRGLFADLTPELAEQAIRDELSESALLGLRFRQNAGRALLMPRPDPARRTPLWLQRLRARDLLQGIRKFPDFPILVETYRECLDDDLELPALRAFLERMAAGEIRVVEHQGLVPSPFVSGLIFKFSLNYLYEWDDPKRADAPRAGVDTELLDPLLDSTSSGALLDPQAIARVEGRLRGAGHPPRTVEEMAEWLGRLGDLAPSELAGPMVGFLAELETNARASTIELPGTREPRRWIGAEEAALYATAFAAEVDQTATSTIVRRYLQTHALIGLDDLMARYPLDPATATDLLERFTDEGELVRVGDDGAARWADRRNLGEVRRLTLAIRRREAVAVLPEVFADFVLRRQHLHPAARREGSAAVGLALEQLAGFAAPAEVWETQLLPARVRDYRPGWLDEALASGAWSWRAAAEAARDPLVAIVPREFAGGWPVTDDPQAASEPEQAVLAELERRGALFVDELARGLALSPSSVRAALTGLLCQGSVTNDRFDPLRAGASSHAEALAQASAASRAGRARLGRSTRLASARPEGRWSRLAATCAVDPEVSLLAWASALLDRYGVLTRETAELEPWAPPWRELAHALARAELRGEVRRGYFVEGLSGIQYALAETAESLSRLAAEPQNDPPPVLVATLDPGNLFGAGAPFDIPLLEGGTARLVRAAGNFVVFNAGRPVLIVEARGRRLTGLASASEAELRLALALLPSLAGAGRRALKVETYNTAATLASPAAPWLSDLGFVRDPPGMVYYAGVTCKETHDGRA
jgi:ATP-dependent Lhr-like helicase